MPLYVNLFTLFYGIIPTSLHIQDNHHILDPKLLYLCKKPAGRSTD